MSSRLEHIMEIMRLAKLEAKILGNSNITIEVLKEYPLYRVNGANSTLNACNP